MHKEEDSDFKNCWALIPLAKVVQAQLKIKLTCRQSKPGRICSLGKFLGWGAKSWFPDNTKLTCWSDTWSPEVEQTLPKSQSHTWLPAWVTLQARDSQNAQLSPVPEPVLQKERQTFQISPYPWAPHMLFHWEWGCCVALQIWSQQANLRLHQEPSAELTWREMGNEGLWNLSVFSNKRVSRFTVHFH